MFMIKEDVKMAWKDFINQIEADLQEAWGVVEDFTTVELENAWGAVKPIFAGILPAQWKILSDLISAGMQDIRTMSIEEVQTALLNLAVKEELAFVKDIESKVLQAIIAIFKPKA